MTEPPYKPPPAPPITRPVLLADLSRIVAAMPVDPTAAGLHIVRLLRVANWHWPPLLDLRHGWRSDALDVLLVDQNAPEPPVAWQRLGCPSVTLWPPKPHWTLARIVLACMAHVPVPMLAEVAVLANQDQPSPADMARLEELAREAWRERRAAVSRGQPDHAAGPVH